MGALDDPPAAKEINDIPPGSPGWVPPAKSGPRGGGMIVFGLILAAAGAIGLVWVNDQQPDVAGLLGAHRVLVHYQGLHTGAVAAIIVGAVLTAFGVMRRTSGR